jgi:hypothetical protein
MLSSTLDEAKRKLSLYLRYKNAGVFSTHYSQEIDKNVIGLIDYIETVQKILPLHTLESNK